MVNLISLYIFLKIIILNILVQESLNIQNGEVQDLNIISDTDNNYILDVSLPNNQFATEGILFIF